MVQALKQDLHTSEEMRTKTERALIHEKMENRNYKQQTEQFYCDKLAVKEAEIDMLRAQLEERGDAATQKIIQARERMVQAEKEANDRIESEYSTLLAHREQELNQERELRSEYEIQLERMRQVSAREKEVAEREYETKLAEDRQFFELETEKVK